jgi:hypothetical protein
MGKEIEKDQQYKSGYQNPDALGEYRDFPYLERVLTRERRVGFRKRSKDKATRTTEKNGSP